MLALEQRNNMLLGRPAESSGSTKPNPQGPSRVRSDSLESKRWSASSEGAVIVRAGDLLGRQEGKIPYIAANAPPAISPEILQQVYLPPASRLSTCTPASLALLRFDRQEMVSADGVLRVRQDIKKAFND